jgi:hypothetical protein
MGSYTIPILFLCLNTISLYFRPTKSGYICPYNKKTYAAIMVKFASPLMHQKMDDSAKEFIIQLAILAWKVSLRNQNLESKSVTRKIKNIAPHVTFEYKKEAVSELIKRKKRYYKKYNFVPISYERYDDELRILAAQPFL